MIEVGQRVEFDPFLYLTGYGAEMIRSIKATGKVVYVNYSHKWFSVLWESTRHSFKFDDIGKVVKICE